MFLALRELRYFKLKYGLIIMITVLLTFMVLFLSGLANGLSAENTSAIRGIDAGFFALSKDSDEIINRSELSENQADTVKNAYRDSSSFNLQRMAICKPDDPLKIDCTYFAIDINSFMADSIDGAASLSDFEIILNNTFKSEGIEKGDKILDSATQTELTVIGFTKDQSYAHSPVGVITLKTFQAIRNELTSDDAITYNAVAIKDDSTDIEALDDDNILILSKDDVIQNIPSYSQEQMTINMILWVLLVVSASILGVFFFVISIQKIPQFGTLKAIGTPMKKIAGTIICQVLIVSGGSILLGDILAFTMAAMMPQKMPFYLEISGALTVSGAFIAVSVLCSLITLIRINSVDPIIAIGGNE